MAQQSSIYDITLDDLTILVPLLFFPAAGFCIKVIIDAFTSNIQATSSIIQYSLMVMYLASAASLIGYYFYKNPGTATTNFGVFVGALFFLLCIYVGVIVLNAMYIGVLNKGFLEPSINRPINNWIMFPQWMLIFYNLSIFLSCQKNGDCPPFVTWITLFIIAFGCMQVSIIITSFRTMEQWPTDDAINNIAPPPALN
jgi:hypothetical protein